MAKMVLDLSHWDDVDLPAWISLRGLWGVIIKAGGNEIRHGRYKDSKFEQHYKAAKEAGLHIGFYYYTVSTSVAEATIDADHFAQLIEGHDYDLPCYMDVEEPVQLALSKRDLTDVIHAFCKQVQAKGHYAGLYIGGDAWINKTYTDELRDYANWIAWWRKNWPTEAGDIGMWQQGGMRLHDADIVYDDVPGYVDLNWCDIDYPSRIKAGMKSQKDVKASETKEATKKVIKKQATKKSSQAKNANPVITGNTADALVEAARKELGYYAPSDPEPGSKYGRWLADVTGEDWLRGPSVEIWWCCCFTSYCLNQANVHMDGFPTQNTDVALNHGARKYAIDIRNVAYGDVVIFNWNGDDKTDHIGIATGSFDGYGFTTIEGNVGNAVVEKYRQLGNVAYVLRPPYTGTSTEQYKSGATAAPKNNRDGGKLDIDGIGGWNTIIDWQNQLGTYEDGVISGQRPSDKDAHWAMSNVKYEQNGSRLVQVVQQKVGAPVTAYWDTVTSMKIQQWLIDKGYSVGESGADGWFGHDSVKALQQSLNDHAWK